MKRTWLTYVAITAAIVAGSLCSTAFAGGGFKFGGGGGNGGGNGGSLRIGGSNSSGGMSINRNSVRGLQSNGSGQSTGGMNVQIKKFPGVVNGNGGGNGGGFNGGSPVIKSNAIRNLQQNNAVRNLQQRINPAIVKQQGLPQIIKKSGGSSPAANSLPAQILGGQFGKGNNNGNGGLGSSIPKAILGGGNGNGGGAAFWEKKDIHCGPIKIGCKPWWSDCHSHHNHCYKPCYPVVYTQPIIVQVPVVVEQVAVAQPTMQVPVGATLTLQSPALGEAAGQVMIQIDKVAIPAMVNEWKPDSVTTTLPMLGLGGQVIADIVMVRADGTVANSIKVELINAQPQAAQAASPAGAVQPAGFQVDQGGAAAALSGL